MDPDAVTMLLEDAICNIEEEEYWKAYQHALKSPYEARTSDEDEEGGEALSDNDEGSNNKSDSSSDSNIVTMEMVRMIATMTVKETIVKTMIANIVAMIGEKPPSDREDEDVGPFYEDHFDDDMDYYDGDIEDDAKAKPIDVENGTKSEEYKL